MAGDLSGDFPFSASLLGPLYPSYATGSGQSWLYGRFCQHVDDRVFDEDDPRFHRKSHLEWTIDELDLLALKYWQWDPNRIRNPLRHQKSGDSSDRWFYGILGGHRPFPLWDQYLGDDDPGGSL